MIRQYRIQDYSFRLILWVVILSVLGIMVIGSAQASSQRRQIVGLALGIIVMIVISFIDYTWLLKFSPRLPARRPPPPFCPAGA